MQDTTSRVKAIDERAAAAAPAAETASAKTAEIPATREMPEVTEGLWLSADEQAAWRTFLYATTLLSERFSEALQSAPGIGLTLGEYEILVRLSEAEHGFLRMSELADQVVHSRSRLTHTISRMEKRGLVERVRCAADGRGRQAQLTAEGVAMLDRAAPTHVRSVREHLVDVIGREDLLELGRILGRTLDDDAPVDVRCPSAHEEPAAPC